MGSGVDPGKITPVWSLMTWLFRDRTAWEGTMGTRRPPMAETRKVSAQMGDAENCLGPGKCLVRSGDGDSDEGGFLPATGKES